MLLMKQGFLFLGLAGCFVVIGLILEPLFARVAVWWMAVTAAWVAVGYLGLGSRVFGKRAEGTVRPVCLAVMLPYISAGIVSAALFRGIMREPAIAQVDDRLYFGRRLMAWESWRLEQRGIVAVLDLTGAFPEPRAIRAGRAYRSICLLDTTAPPLDVLTDAVNWLLEQSEAGPVYVHCAIGHGRAGMMAAAYLLVTGKSTSVEDCVEVLRGVRPLLSISSLQRARLEELANSIAR